MITLNLFQLGTGLVGSNLLEQIHKEKDRLKRDYLLDIRVIGMGNVDNMAFDSQGFDLSDWRKFLKEDADKTDIGKFVQKMRDYNLVNPVFVDCTGSDEVVDAYQEIFKSKISIVTPNKKANSRSYALYLELKNLSRRNNVKFYYETNITAGLPIISPIDDLLKMGDKILKIEAVTSATLNYILNNFDKNKPFSEVTKQAQKLGYTEPDPREDLMGIDVKRKILLLARESGYDIEPEEVVNNLILPEEFFKAPSLQDFYEKLEQYDPILSEKKIEAEKQGKRLRHIASFENGKAHVGLQAIDRDHYFYGLYGTSQSVAIFTKFYPNPLVIRGSGTGGKTTAAEVLRDIIKVVNV